MLDVLPGSDTIFNKKTVRNLIVVRNILPVVFVKGLHKSRVLRIGCTNGMSRCQSSWKSGLTDDTMLISACGIAVVRHVAEVSR